MISKSDKHNPNYLAKVVELKGVHKHPGADRLQVVTIDFQNVITGMDAKDGDLYVYFPLESTINKDFLSFTNSFRDKDMNTDKEEVGFFEAKGRVRAVKLRGEKSMGYLVPVQTITQWININIPWGDHIGEEFDTIGDKLMVEKYIVPNRGGLGTNKQGKKPRVTRLIENQVRLHADTENLRKNAHKIDSEDLITISYKIHGTSFWVGNLMVKRYLKFYEKILKFLGINIQDTEYDYVYGSRKVVKNADMIDLRYSAEKLHFYEYDLWGDIKDELKEFIPKGYTLYGECVGFLKGGGAIQPQYDYACDPGKKEIRIYRITSTNVDGIVHDLSTEQMKEFCDYYGLKMIHVFYSGKAGEMYPELDQNLHWHESFIRNLERDYNDKDCFICKTPGLPEEGIVLRREKLFSFDAYKLKSWRFLQRESELLDKEEVDIESIN